MGLHLGQDLQMDTNKGKLQFAILSKDLFTVGTFYQLCFNICPRSIRQKSHDTSAV